MAEEKVTLSAKLVDDLTLMASLGAVAVMFAERRIGFTLEYDPKQGYRFKARNIVYGWRMDLWEACSEMIKLYGDQTR